MLNYNQELIVDSDTERCGSYLATNYEFFFPEMPILKEREKESMRYQIVCKEEYAELWRETKHDDNLLNLDTLVWLLDRVHKTHTHNKGGGGQ